MAENHPTTNRPEGVDILIANANADQGRIHARAGFADISTPVADSGVQAKGKIMTAGVDGQVGTEYTGLGVEATLVEASAEYKDVGGVKLGLSADTGLGIGSQGAQAKILGTGVKADGKGVELTVLGSGLKLGSWASPYNWFGKKD